MPPRAAWLWMTALAFILAAPVSAGVEDGVKKWRAGDYAGAVAEWRDLAASGNRDAQFNLGQAYKLGRGVPADPQKAIELYRKAAEQGHEPAEANLGWVLFQQGKRLEALPMLQRAARRGDAHSRYLLGVAYFNGDVVQQDWARAYRLMSSAAASGMPQARDALSAMEARIPLAQRQTALATPDELLGRPARTTATSKQLVTAQPAPNKTAQQVPARAAAVQTRAAMIAAQPARTAESDAARMRDWRIQLGAFSSHDAAAAAWTKLSRTIDGLGRLGPYYEMKGTVVRLQAGPIEDKASANGMCAKVAAAGGACFPVRP